MANNKKGSIMWSGRCSLIHLFILLEDTEGVACGPGTALGCGELSKSFPVGFPPHNK